MVRARPNGFGQGSGLTQGWARVLFFFKSSGLSLTRSPKRIFGLGTSKGRGLKEAAGGSKRPSGATRGDQGLEEMGGSRGLTIGGLER